MCKLPCVVRKDSVGPGGGRERTLRARAPKSCYPLEPPALGVAGNNCVLLVQRSWAHGAKLWK